MQSLSHAATFVHSRKTLFQISNFLLLFYIQTVQFNDKGQPLYSGNTNIKYISKNRNLDICVADCGTGAVLVVNQAGKLRF